jgi:hypothetical protein
MKTDLKNKAITLRREGNTYSEIMKVIPVAKSTLSEWLRDVGISKRQIQFFSEKKRLASLKGGLARRNQRIDTFNRITGKAEKEIGKISKRELWLLGIALYWAEGSKEKEARPGSGVIFINSDVEMIVLFLKWLFEICHVSKEEIRCEIYLHDSYKYEVARFQKFWSEKTGLSLGYFNTIYFKRNKINTKRKNIGDLYNGQLRVKVYRSSSLNRQITGWVRGICKNLNLKFRK